MWKPTAGCNNAALAERRDAWAASKTRIYYEEQSAQLTEIRAVRPDVAVWSFSSQQATLRWLNKAFAGFSGGSRRPSPSPMWKTLGSLCPTVPGRSPGSIGVSVTLAGAGSSRFCAPKRKRLGLSGGRPPAHLGRLRKMRVCRRRKPHHPSGIRLPAMRPSRTGRRTCRPQHLTGRAGPSRPSGVRRSRRHPAAGEVTILRP